MKLTPEQVAKICHEANRAYCEALGDHTQLPWARAHDWQKESAVAGVKLLLKYPGLTPKQMHENWLDAKQAEGWSYAPIKNVEKRQHPCMCTYDKLPEEDRAKDELFSAVVLSLMGRTAV